VKVTHDLVIVSCLMRHIYMQLWHAWLLNGKDVDEGEIEREKMLTI